MFYKSKRTYRSIHNPRQHNQTICFSHHPGNSRNVSNKGYWHKLEKYQLDYWHSMLTDHHQPFCSFSVGYKNFAYLEGSFRVDNSSTLPTDENTYFYPAISGSLILSELNGIKDLSFLSFAKLRANYAEVGNDTDPYNILTPVSKKS